MEQTWNANGAIEFFQLVRSLERELWIANERHPESTPTDKDRGLGEWADDAYEPIRFRPTNSLINPDHAVAKLNSRSADATRPDWLVDVTFFGLVGPMGVLPPYFTTWLLGEGEAARPALRDFLALFEHRFISRFYRAWEQSRYLYGFERSVRQNRDDNTHGFTLAIRALTGFADRTLTKKLTLSDRLPAYYSGLLSNLVRPAENLPRIVNEVFEVPCKLVEFIAEWQVIPRRQQTRIGLGNDLAPRTKPDPWNSRLGLSACMGSRVWTVQDRFRVSLGPLNYETFLRFVPSGDLFPKLRELVKLYAGIEMTFDIQPTLRPEEVPCSQLGARPDGGTRLGWNSWLGIRPHTQPATDAIFSGSA